MNTISRLICQTFLGVCLWSIAILSVQAESVYDFTEADIRFLSQFHLSQLPPPPSAFGNALADDAAAAQLGRELFFDPGLSRNGKVSCASCHQPEQYFTDGLQRSVGLGQVRRNAPSIATSQYGPWQFWDGRADSLWAQALSPLEDINEHGIARSQAVQYVASHYHQAYDALFAPLDIALIKTLPEQPASPRQDSEAQQRWNQLSHQQQQVVNQVFANIGKALMAYQRQIQLQPAPFDRFVTALQQGQGKQQLARLMTADEVSGMRLFMGKGNCASCHNGPLFTNFEFHNIGAPEPNQKQVDMGRFEGVTSLQKNEFTCLSPYSDANPWQCEEMQFLKRQGPELVGAFKTPSLRNVAETAPYMQSGQLASLIEVIAHYNKPTPPFYDREQHPSRPHFDIVPLNLTEEEQQQLLRFLDTLTSPIDASDRWWLATDD